MSRKLEDLELETEGLARKYLAACSSAGLDVLVTCTLRTMDEQSALYAEGRTRPGQIVTWAKAGESPHNFGLAFDVVGLRNSKPVWEAGDPLWTQLGSIASAVGLDWGGLFERGKIDKPHMQRPNWKHYIGAIA